MRERVLKAARRYLELLGYVRLDQGTVNGFLVYDDDTDLVFINVCWKKSGFSQSSQEALRDSFEEALAEWFENPMNIEPANFIVRCDEISVNILSDERALIRHTRNAFNKED